ncbi:MULTISPECIES: hypothetical protein [Inquilinus]|uniref:Uncharacterized protein n=1 Tax=Inquilinus ginsengisoli TaxID=363840 RepID=A0ABU1JUH8_9PROT|nr:hypothetical protein [Inquilinus ginsengisoli]MDR6292280.1 hypothetical protein [Inquilinus ginsengisoli]
MGRIKAFLIYGSILAAFLVIILMVAGGYGPWGAIKAVGSTFVLVLVVFGIVMAMASS